MAQKCNCVWIGKGVKGTNGCIHTQWRVNANWPAHNLCGGDCFEYGMMCIPPYGYTCSNFDASTLCRGFEIFQGASMQRYCIGASSCLNGIYCRCLQWIHCDGSIMWTSSGKHCINMCTDAESWQWQYYFYFLQMGVNCWEIDVDGEYCLRNCITCYSGDDLSITTQYVAKGICNVPSAPSTGPTRGVIWVEGNNLHFRPTQSTEAWEHAMVGDCQGAGASPGAIWIDTNHYLHWANSSGDDYRAKWRDCQFCSWFGNSSGPNPSPGAGHAGAIWADGEFGYSHLAYIGCDGKKYITGAGNCAYIAP